MVSSAMSMSDRTLCGSLASDLAWRERENGLWIAVLVDRQSGRGVLEEEVEHSNLLVLQSLFELLEDLASDEVDSGRAG